MFSQIKRSAKKPVFFIMQNALEYGTITTCDLVIMIHPSKVESEKQAMEAKEKEILKNRFLDLYHRSTNRGIYTYSGFLYAEDAALAYAAANRDHVLLFGGFPEAERVMVRFGNEKEVQYAEPFPIAVLVVMPVNPGFSDSLTHRDYLGALMSLGMKRSVIGDILVRGKTAWILAEKNMSEYICRELVQVRHTSVVCSPADSVPEDVIPQKQPVMINVASARADAVVARLYHLSRKDAAMLFSEGRILVNGLECKSESRTLKEQECITVRGFGRFRYLGVRKETRKKREEVVCEVWGKVP